jgi:hypothetical protein
VETQLIEWNSIKASIAQCKDIEIMSKMNYSLEAIQKWAKQSKQSLETQNEIAEYRLRLNRKQGEWIEQNIPETGTQCFGDLIKSPKTTLADAGIDRNDSPKFRTLARIPEEKFEAYISESKELSQEITTNDACRLLGNTIATKWTRDQESYTPSLYIEAARSVMGSIDCDPASNKIAQRVVQAKVFFTPEENGLKQSWQGNIFLNPPYSHPEVSQFVDKLLAELKAGQQAILLTNNNTDTSFFHKAAKRAAVICLTKGRINFYKADGETKTSPTNGQVFFYFGDYPERFIKIFSQFGLLVKAL